MLMDDVYYVNRSKRYRTAAQEKAQEALHGQLRQENYYLTLVKASSERSDEAAQKDRHQLEKDFMGLDRTFPALPPLRHPEDKALLAERLRRIILAYIERGRSLSTNTRAAGLARASLAATTARGILSGYQQGLDRMAGMCLLAISSGEPQLLGLQDLHLARIEEDAFWLLACLLEDVLDPDFFGADVRGNLKMVNIGGLGLRSIILDKAKVYCPSIYATLGPEVFESCLGLLLDGWVLSCFIGCAPHRLLEHFWDHLLLPSPYHPADRSRSLPSGLKLIIGFGLCALKCCGEDHFKDSQELQRLRELSKVSDPEVLALEATELIVTMKQIFEKWPEEKDNDFFLSFTRILSELAEEAEDFQCLWDDVRSRKQAIADCAGNCDEQLMTLAQRTHFSVEEIERLRKEVTDMRRNPKQPAKVDLDSFKDLVKRAVPEFPTDLCGRLFQKLDCFRVGRLSFVELACGMSALSLGTMDEKLQVCFDMFDSEGRRALSLSDVNDLCSTLFRVALSSGMGQKHASTDEVVSLLSRRSTPIEDDLGNAATFAGGGSSSFLPSTPPQRKKTLVPKNPSEQDPSRSMLLRLLAAAKVRTPGGPWLVAFEDFCNAARMEPALLCLFSWCLPRPPQNSLFLESTNSQSEQPGFVSRWCTKICRWFRSR
ncbi:unnamed protein product [Durusdinium trenchii]|uniref:Rab-GAP TBC domain-containing protein n=1 Tax=Durusdinium trenchii TaxID=1381693 RepID=A0ABP0I429_9DINO